MLIRPTARARPLCLSLSLHTRRRYRSKCSGQDIDMDQDKRDFQANFRLCNVSSHTTELLEICADNPKLHILFIPGNPGVVQFYKDFVESLYGFLGGRVSITAIGHISHTKKNWEHGRLFSLQEQIDHKIDFIRQELGNTEVPVLLVGHSIGSYICIDVFRRSPEKVTYCIGLYPFLALNLQSTKQSNIGKIATSRVLSTALSLIVALLGFFPSWALRLIVKNSLGKSWSASAVEAACSHLVQYHTIRNILFMAMTEFIKLRETPDWMFMREKQEKITFLFGVDDHWGPLQMFEEISKQVPGIAKSIEREGYTHDFSCTVAGSSCIANYVASLIKKQL